MEARYPYLAAEGLPAATPPSEPHAAPAPEPYITPAVTPSAERLTTPAAEASPTFMPGRDATATSPTAPLGFPLAEPPGSTLLYHEQPRIDVDLGPLRPADHGPDITWPTGERGGEPLGPRSINLPNVKSTQKTSTRSENTIASELASAGYRVIQNPRIPPEQMAERGLKVDKNPDFIVEGRVFDLYTPTVETASKVYAGIADKISKGQTDRVVVELRQSSMMRAELEAELKAYPIVGLKEVITITKYGVGHAFPK